MCSCIECVGDQPEPTVEELLSINDDLRRQLAEAQAENDAFRKAWNFEELTKPLKEQLAEAQARLAELDKQKPVYCVVTDDGTYEHHDHYIPLADCFKLYARPTPSHAAAGAATLQDRLAAIAEANGFFSANHLAKAEDELGELQAAPYDSHEMADVVLAIMLHAEQHGVDLLLACEEKLRVVAARKYGSADERGVVRHVEVTQPDSPAHRAAKVLMKAVEKLARLGNGDRYGNSEGNVIAQTALATAKQIMEGGE